MPRVSDLTEATAVDADDPLYVVEDGNSRRTTSVAVVKAGSNASGDAPVYACRAWVNFNGTGTVAIRGSGNVSSITDNGTGDYTVNFATALPDANYAAVATSGDNDLAQIVFFADVTTPRTASLIRIRTTNTAFALTDCAFVNVSVFR